MAVESSTPRTVESRDRVHSRVLPRHTDTRTAQVTVRRIHTRSGFDTRGRNHRHENLCRPHGPPVASSGQAPNPAWCALRSQATISLHYAPQDLGQLSAWPRPEPNPEFRFLQSGNPLTPLSLPSQTRKLPLIIRFPNRSAAENAGYRLALARARQTNYYGRRRP